MYKKSISNKTKHVLHFLPLVDIFPSMFLLQEVEAANNEMLPQKPPLTQPYFSAIWNDHHISDSSPFLKFSFFISYCSVIIAWLEEKEEVLTLEL